MAIVVEESKARGAGIISFFIWLVFLVLIGMGVYYVFVKKPDLIPVAEPKSFQDAQAISTIKLDSQAIVSKLNPPSFDSHITIMPAQTNGRQNPFLSN